MIGYTFSSPRWRSDPVEEITKITSQYPNHTADAFYYPQSPSLPPIATITVTLDKVLAGKSIFYLNLIGWYGDATSMISKHLYFMLYSK